MGCRATTIRAQRTGDAGTDSRRSVRAVDVTGQIRPFIGYSGSYMTLKLPTPTPVRRALIRLGRDLSRTRRRHRLSRASLAERAGVSEATLKRLERGDARVALESLARALQILGAIDRFEQLLNHRNDELGLLLMEEQLPQRIRRRRTSATF